MKPNVTNEPLHSIAKSVGIITAFLLIVIPFILKSQEPDPFGDFSNRYIWVELQTKTGLTVDGKSISTSEFKALLSNIPSQNSHVYIFSEKGTHRAGEGLKIQALAAGHKEVHFFPFIRPRLGGFAQPEFILEYRLSLLTIPEIRTKETPLTEIVDFIRERGIEIDWANTYTPKGIELILRGDNLKGMLLTFEFEDIRLGELLWEVAKASDLEMTVEQNAVVLAPHGTNPPYQRHENAKKVDPEIWECCRQLYFTDLPGFRFHETPLPEAIDYLIKQTHQLLSEKFPDRDSLEFVTIGVPRNSDKRVSLKLIHPTIHDAIKYTCYQVGYDFRLLPQGIVIFPSQEGFYGDGEANTQSKTNNGR